MENYQKEFAVVLAESGSLFFADGLRLKDGRPTPYFVNLGLFRTGRLISRLGSLMAGMLVAKDMIKDIDVIVGPSYKGSALAVAVVQSLWSEHQIDMLFDYDRKEAKQHGEATGKSNFFVTNAMFSGARVFIVDDVVTTMGTKYDLLKLIDSESKAKDMELSVVGVGLAVDRKQTTAVLDENNRVIEGVKGEDAVAAFESKTGVPVQCLVGIKEVVEYLAEEKIPVLINGVRQPMDTAALDDFHKYFNTYGVEER